jgi:hypothetical protein
LRKVPKKKWNQARLQMTSLLVETPEALKICLGRSKSKVSREGRAPGVVEEIMP